MATLGSLPALSIQTPQIDLIGSAQQSRAADLQNQAAQQQVTKQHMEMLAQGAAYALDGKWDQPADPKKWGEVIDSFEAGGMPRDQAEQLRSRPDLAPVLLKSSHDALMAAEDQTLFPLKLKSMQVDLANAMNPTIVTHPGDVLRNKNTGALVGGDGGSSGFYGSSTEQQAYQILATGDPSTYQYAQAYSFLSQPTQTVQPDGKGGMVMVSTPRQLPQGTKAPTYKGDIQPSAPAGAPATQPPANGGSMDLGAPDRTAPIGTMAPASNGPTVTQVPGLHSTPTESQVRSGVLSDTLDAVAPTVLKNFDVLADPTGQALGAVGPIGNIFQSPEYQQASAAMASALQTIVFQLSGANTGTNEMLNTARSMTPAVGDKPETIAFKKNLFISYVKSIADASKDPDKKKAAQDMLDKMQAPDTTDSGGVPKNADETKTLDGKTYYRQGSDWYQVN